METKKDRQEIERIAKAIYNAVPDGVKVYNYINALMALIVCECCNAIEAGTPQNLIEEITIRQLKSFFEAMRNVNNKLN